MTVRSSTARLVAAALLLTALAAPVVGGARTTTPAHADVTGTGGDFVQVPSAVVADSRYGTGITKAPLGEAKSIAIPIAGHGGVPATGVRAVLVNLSVFAPSATTYLALYQSGTTYANDTSIINVAAKTTNLSNTDTVALGNDGKIALYNRSGSINFEITVLGYYTAATGPSGPGGYHPTPYTRVLDTRSGLGAAKAKIPAGKSVSFTVTGGPVPADADSVYLDVIVPAATAGGWLTDNPYGSSTPGNGVLDFYANSLTSHLVAVRPAGGKVSFVNHSSVAIDLVATQEGYTTSTSTTGDGFHPSRQRLISNLTLAGNTTTTVAVAGRPGLPTQNISGAVLNFAVTSTAGGYITAYGTGNTEPVASVLSYPANVTHAGTAAVAVTSAGSITIHNPTSTAVKIYVDLEGWFTPEHRTATLQQFSPTVGIQLPASGNAAGAIEYTYTDNVGRLLVGYQSDPDIFQNGVTWKTVSSTGDLYTGQPSLTTQADGSVALNAEYGDTGIHTLVLPANDGGREALSPAFDTGGSFAALPAVALLSSNNLLYSFAVDDAGALWIRAAGSTALWVGHHNVVLHGTPTAISTSNGIQLFAVTTTGQVVTALYQGGMADPAWTSLGGAGVTDRPAVAVRPGYLFQVVVRQGDGQIVTKAQNPDGTYPSAWSTVDTFQAIGAPAAVFDPVSGKIEILARSAADQQIWNSGETVQGSQTWRTWAPVSNGYVSATDPTISTYTGSDNGDGWFAPFRTPDNGTQVIVRNYPNGATGASRPTFHITQVEAPAAH